MAGSKGGKRSKGKGSKSNKSDAINQKPEISNCKLELGQTSNIHRDRQSDPKDKNPQLDSCYPLSTDRYSYTEKELEDFLYMKIELLYTKAREQLLKSGYSMAEVETAILHAGFFQGPMDLLYNILKNSIVYIETKVQPNTEAFGDMSELCKSMVETMIYSMMQTRQGIQRSDAVWYLLIRKWDRAPSTTTSSHLLSGNMNGILIHESNGNSSIMENKEAGAFDLSSTEKVLSESLDPSFKKVGFLKRINLTPALVSHLRQRVLILTDAVHRTIGHSVIWRPAIPSAHGKPTEVADIVGSDLFRTIIGCSDEASLRVWLRSNSDNPSTTHIVDLIKHVRELHEKVKEQKEWAQKKVRDSARRLSKDLLELKMLRLENFDKETIKNEKTNAEKLCILMLLEAEQCVRKANSEATFLVDSVRILDRETARISAIIEELKLDVSEYDRELPGVLKKVRKCYKKIVNNEKQVSIIHSQIQDEKQRVLCLEVELLQAEEEADKAEENWKMEITTKERMFALIAEEMRTAETQKANSKAQLLKLKQKVEIDSELARDDLQRREDELSRLQLPRPIPDMFEDVDFFFNSIEASSSSAPYATFESSEKLIGHWSCMMCLKNEVSVVFLPCTHQVLCSSCYSENFRTKGGQCPYCKEKIEESIKVYGRRS